MESLFKASGFISKLCQFIGSLCIVISVLATAVGVTTRYLFKLTNGEFGFVMQGGVEIVSYCMLFSLLAAFAAYIERAQIIVDLFTQKMPKSVKGFLMAIFLLGFAVIGAIFAWGLYESAVEAHEVGTFTQDLRISFTPIYSFAAFLSGLLAIRSLIESIKIFKTGEFFDAEEIAHES
ncbi:TRAP transporter small permease [Neisseria montereyensis]|uniref:TRAP transporter small permease protein n=1 Tax=Neisseria montereyensis TaxID=2973938 RepID=A0ABT2FBB1_9NEIS|nr:TRAP transporter small permease [Neisseria montereyensis]MCS4533255.1 TRAP transporter small permease [Neisseria montereyensis]